MLYIPSHPSSSPAVFRRSPRLICRFRNERAAEEAILSALHERFGSSSGDGLEKQRDRRLKGWSSSEKKTEWQVKEDTFTRLREEEVEAQHATRVSIKGGLFLSFQALVSLLNIRFDALAVSGVFGYAYLRRWRRRQVFALPDDKLPDVRCPLNRLSPDVKTVIE